MWHRRVGLQAGPGQREGTVLELQPRIRKITNSVSQRGDVFTRATASQEERPNDLCGE